MLTPQDLADLQNAYDVLENPGFAVRLQNMLGASLEQGMKRLPENWRSGIQKATEVALNRALTVAAASFSDKKEATRASNAMHKLLAAGSGAVGGAFGLPALAVELPVSTVIMLRSIADIARSEGEDISQLESKLACLQVFALGGKNPGDDATETGYYAVRAVLSQQIGEVARYVAKAGIADSSAPVLMRFISSIASRFGIVVSEKAMATAVPLIGAAGGAIVNALFIDHFQDVARAHFTIRRLERSAWAGTGAARVPEARAFKPRLTGYSLSPAATPCVQAAKLPLTPPPDFVPLLHMEEILQQQLLLIEDNEADAYISKRRLERRGYEVTVVASGAASLAYLEANTPDLILLDIRLGDVNGNEIARFVRQHATLAATPIIAVTTGSFPHEKRDTSESGCDAHFSKPYNFEKLVETIRELLSPAAA